MLQAGTPDDAVDDLEALIPGAAPFGARGGADRPGKPRGCASTGMVNSTASGDPIGEHRDRRVRDRRPPRGGRQLVGGVEASDTKPAQVSGPQPRTGGPPIGSAVRSVDRLSTRSARVRPAERGGHAVADVTAGLAEPGRRVRWMPAVQSRGRRGAAPAVGDRHSAGLR